MTNKIPLPAAVFWADQFHFRKNSKSYSTIRGTKYIIYFVPLHKGTARVVVLKVVGFTPTYTISAARVRFPSLAR